MRTGRTSTRSRSNRTKARSGRTKSTGSSKRTSGKSKKSSGRSKSSTSSRSSNNPNKKLGKAAFDLGLATMDQLKEAGRILDVRKDIGEPTSIDQILFERGILTPLAVQGLWEKTGVRLVFCPSCQTRKNSWGTKPGKSIKCISCKTRIQVPGNDPEDPYATGKAPKAERRQAVKQSKKAVFFGFLGILLLGGIMVDAAVESWGTHMGIPAAGTAGVFLILAYFLHRRRQYLAASGLGLAMLTGLVMAAVIGNSPTQASLIVGGGHLGAHNLVGPLVVLHLFFLFGMYVGPLLRVSSPWPLLIIIAPMLYGLLFFGYRCIPTSNPAHLLSGPAMFDNVPWFLHPGFVTLAVLFPLATLAIVGAGVGRFFKRGQGTLLRDSGLILGMLLLSASGLALGAIRGEIPNADLKHQVEQAVGPRIAPWWTESDQQKGTTAAAVKPADQAGD